MKQTDNISRKFEIELLNVCPDSDKQVNVSLNLYNLKKICMQMSHLGIAMYMSRFEPRKDNLSERAAFRIFTEKRIERLLGMKKISKIRSGDKPNSPFIYSYAEIMGAIVEENMKMAISY